MTTVPTLGDDTVRGTVAPGYEKVAAVYRGGLPVLRLTGGSHVVTSGDAVPYDETTIQLVASATKFVESLCMILLVDRGLLRYDDRIADHWPEFDGGDPLKAQVTVRQLMMHRAGLPVFERKLGDDELFDLDARARFLERQRHVPGLFAAEPAGGDWRRQRPAPPQAYHAVSRGLYSSELVRRVDPQRRRLGQFFRDEIAEPLGIDFWIGLPDDQAPRVSATRADPTVIMRLMSGDGGALTSSNDPRYAFRDYEIAFLRQLLTAPESIASRALNCLAPSGVAPHELANHPRLRSCELASSSGFGRFSGDIDGATVSIGWGGAGGQLVRLVPELDLAVAYVTNTLGSRMAMHDPRGLALVAATVECARG